MSVKMHHVLLQDFAIHGFDFAAIIVPGIVLRVFVSNLRLP